MKIRFLLIGAVLSIMAIVPILASCSPAAAGTTSKDSTTTSTTTTETFTAATDANLTYKPTWIEPTVGDRTLSIPVATVLQDVMTHFKMTPPSGKQETFMAYYYQGQIYVRGDWCACQSINFDMKGNLLICTSCGTTFDTVTGKGTGTVGSPNCRTYPKESAVYQTQDGKLVMKVSDLDTAYQNTLKQG
jgi:nitrite reductase/ring-hydroxylating ferredoxin subunit